MSTRDFVIAEMALEGALLLATGALLFLTIRHVRKRQDPARKAFPWLKATLVLYMVYLCSDIVHFALQLVQFQPETFGPWEQAVLLVGYISDLFFALVDILTFIVLTCIATAIQFVHTGKPHKSDGIIRKTMYSTAALLVPLVVAVFGLSVRVGGMQIWDAALTASDISIAFRVLVFLVSLAVIARSILICGQSRPDVRVAKMSELLLAASAVWLLHTLYRLISSATIEKVVLVFTLYGTRPGNPNFQPYHALTELFFSNLPMAVIFSIMYMLGSRKVNGLWSTPQPWMPANSDDQGSPRGDCPKDAGPHMLAGSPADHAWLMEHQDAAQELYALPAELPAGPPAELPHSPAPKYSELPTNVETNVPSPTKDKRSSSTPTRAEKAKGDEPVPVA